MLPFLAYALATQVTTGQPPRLRTVLPNGIVTLIERRPGAKDLVVDLFAATRGTDESPTTHGRRHMLEHLVALGAKGDLDRKLETAGGFLMARTLRDSMVFEMSLPTSGLKTGLSAIRDIVAGPAIDAAAVTRETKILEEEQALRENSARASTAVWARAYGSRGLDPFGDLEVFRTTKPEDLDKLRKETFAASNLLVVVSGDVDLDTATNAVKDALGFLPVVKPPKPLPNPELSIGNGTADITGEYRGVAVPGFRSPATAATLAAALALANTLDHAEVTYTPSVRPSLVLLGVSEGRMGDRIGRVQAAELFQAGRQLAARWVRARLGDPAQAAAFRGMLMVQAIDVRPETMLENLQSLSFEEFSRAVDAFQNHAVVVEGAR